MPAPSQAPAAAVLLAGPSVLPWAGAAVVALGIYAGRDRKEDRAAAADLILVALLFAVTPPLVGFSLCFAAIHPPRALAAHRPGRSVATGSALLPVALTALGVAIHLSAAGRVPADNAVRTSVLLLSALTVPHMWLEWRARCASSS